MPRLLLVARNPGLAFGLGSASDDIIEVRPSLVDRLTVSPGMADVVVIEQERAVDALTTLDTLRTGGLMAPALLVASTRSDWVGFDPASRPSVAVLDPPITQDRLGQAIGAAAGLPDAEDVTTSQSTPESVAQRSAQPEPRSSAVDAHVPDQVEVALADALTDVEPEGDSIAQADSNGESHEPSEEPPGHQEDAPRPDEDLPIAAAAAHANATSQNDVPGPAETLAVEHPTRPEDEQSLPDGPADLEPPDDPYATATRVPVEHGPAAPGLPDTQHADDGDALAADADLVAAVAPHAVGDADHNEDRLGASGSGTAPRLPLHEEGDVLSVAEGTPSPAALPTQATEPVLAWEGTSDEAGVYAEMALLVAASGERLADEPQDPDGPVNDPDDVEDMPSVDLSRVFGEPPRAAEVEAHAKDDVAAVPQAVPGPADGPTEVPEARPEAEVVDVRDQFPEDPRSTPSLVRALLARSNEVYGVTEAGALVVADALARTGASSGALLLPDGDTWRVAAGDGLRRLESRYVLTADSWLVTTIASRHKGLIIDRTDVARRPLAGAPLAAHKHLVAAPVRAVAGILLIARDVDPGFGERDLMSLARLAEASSDILAAALDARQLARLLGDIRDQDDRAAADRIDYGL